MTLDIEGVVDGNMGSEKSLGRTLRFETLLPSLSPPDRQMGIFGAVVFSQSAGAMTISTAKLACCGAIGRQPVSDDCFRMHPLALEQFSEQPQSRSLVAPFLNQHVKNLALVIDGPPQEHSPPPDPHYHLVEMPAAGGTRPGPSKIASEESAELPGPAADGLIADIHAAFGHQIFNIPKTQCEPKVQPHCLTNDIRRISVTGIGNRLHHLRSHVATGASEPQIERLSIKQVIAAR